MKKKYFVRNKEVSRSTWFRKRHYVVDERIEYYEHIKNYLEVSLRKIDVRLHELRLMREAAMPKDVASDGREKLFSYKKRYSR